METCARDVRAGAGQMREALSISWLGGQLLDVGTQVLGLLDHEQGPLGASMAQEDGEEVFGHSDKTGPPRRPHGEVPFSPFMVEEFGHPLNSPV